MKTCRKILVVEDNDMNRVLLRNILEHFGYGVVEAENGRTGVEAAVRENPLLVFMDIMMPVMDGFAALKVLKAGAGTKDLKIFALTSFAMKGDEERIKAAGFDGYLAKPIEKQKLLEVVRSVQHACETTVA